jgi:hypothetical protein
MMRSVVTSELPQAAPAPAIGPLARPLPHPH